MTSKVGFGTAYKLFWKNYVNFTGRSRRSEYWYTVLWHIIVCIPGILLLVGGVIGLIMGLIDNNTSASGVSVLCLIIGWIYLVVYGLATLIPNYALLIRRFHDTGRTMVMPIILFVFSIIINVVPSIINVQQSDNNNLTGSIIALILYLVVFVLSVYQIVVCCLDSQRQRNKYGVSPKYKDAEVNNHGESSHEQNINN
ncbi:DUF805 domain-containing protein [Staphylococcus sp. 18_1_E_LY]|uniref:DUF805 domain-containing protein n=1 Tax=Staphylococcus lloydii TaxID=2781774 RepID=A0A7T1B0Y9_9STAP|nr:DUF805 domain-containing protein [Staphylococcus lloydii]MBF7020385.1 DUF805 domain-containing protein [Staphylococcus lloydii]MBF7028068.1 DUF805 domain-containing protein [Staphylococcus lloydii]QPM75732.1 DUF805 domain-containing protein [Staphylococcus lloydii]